MTDDPERARVEALLARVSDGSIDEAGTEELALYVCEQPPLRAEVERRARESVLGGGWLARLEGDRRIAAVETTRRTRVEQVTGLALLAGVYGLTLISPPAGAAAIVLGLVLLLWSTIRVRLATHRHDPYNDVQR